MRKKDFVDNMFISAALVIGVMCFTLGAKTPDANAGECELAMVADVPDAAVNEEVTEPETEEAIKLSPVITVGESRKEVKDTEEETQEAEGDNTECQGIMLNDHERYELAKIVMAEAEGENRYTKAMIAFVVLNRVNSTRFPNDVHSVIFQRTKGAYQFSPMVKGGRWWRKEPNAECYEVVDAIVNGSIADTSQGALYFEAISNKSKWHRNNLEFLFESCNTRFYR